MMHHKQCGGPVFHDMLYYSEGTLDLACLMCGKRWHIKKKNPLARYIIERARK